MRKMFPDCRASGVRRSQRTDEMTRKLEAHMIPPIRVLMRDLMGLDVIVEEFSADYGIADLVGAEICPENAALKCNR